MSTPMLKPNAQTTLVKLHQQHKELLREETFSETTPVTPIGEVTQQRVGVRTSIGNIRFLFLLPWLIGVCLALHWQVEDFYKAWHGQEIFHLDFINARKKKYGEDYFQTTKDPVVLRMYNRLLNEKKMPLESYLDIRYRYSVGAERALKADIIFGGGAVLTIIILIISILIFKRRAPLYFDREKNLVYTWRKGKVWAQFYNAQWYYQNNIAMTFILYSLHRKHPYKMRRFVVTPSGNPFMNGETLYRPVLAFIHQFMEKGRDAVFKTDWQGRQGWYLFNDNKPKDFDQQLEKTLQVIEQEKVNPQADQLAKGWGF